MSDGEPGDDGRVLTVAKVEHYLDLTKRARAAATPTAPSGSHLDRTLTDFLRMCDDYQSDAAHFLAAGDLIRAFGAINYAHAWLDAGVRLGLLDAHGDDVLFTLP